jgi:hypothetical protein
MSNSVSSSSEHQSLLDAVDARTKLAGSNRMELLLFGIGTPEIFAINVFKVREVTKTPPITLTPNMPEGVEGGSSGVTERCVPRVWNLGELFASRAIVDDGEKVN